MPNRGMWTMNGMDKMLFSGYYNVELISSELTKKVMKFIEDETVNTIHLEGVVSSNSNYSKDGVELLKPYVTQLIQNAIGIQYEYETKQE